MGGSGVEEGRACLEAVHLEGAAKSSETVSVGHIQYEEKCCSDCIDWNAGVQLTSEPEWILG